MKIHACEICGAKIPSGDLYYNFTAKFISGFDNYIPEPEVDAEQLITQAIKAIAGRSEKELTDDVYEEISLLLCPSCRKKIQKSLIPMKTVKPKSEKILHFTPPRKK